MRKALRLTIRLGTTLLIALAVFWWIARPDRPDAFYRPGGAIAPTATPGTLLAHEEMSRLSLPRTRGFRILYTTTRPDGTPASAVVVVPDAQGPVLDRGWAYVATDYAGLGTEGGHPYLIGQDSGRAVQDSIRAARQISGIALSDQLAIWGHSQGGHSALWAGQPAP